MHIKFLCIGELILTPSNLVSVCSGEQLSLACSTDQSNYLRWTTLLPDIYSISGAIVRTIAKDFRTGQAGPAVEIDSTTDIRFFKNSAVNALPLRSTLQVNNVPAAFNGTRISCTEYGTTGLTSEVTISVLDINQFEGILTSCRLALDHNVLSFLSYTSTSAFYR